MAIDAGPKPFNFKLFQEADWPSPLPGKDTVLISCDVYQDGVGDAVNFLEFAELMTPKLKERGFKVVGAIRLGKTGQPYYHPRKEALSCLRG